MQKPYGERTMTVSDEEYDALPDDRLWTAHRSVVAAEFFETWKDRMQRLLTMPVPPSTSETDLVPKFYQRVVGEGMQNEPKGEEDWEAHFDDEWYDGDLGIDDDEQARDESLELEPVDMMRPASVSSLVYNFSSSFWLLTLNLARCSKSMKSTSATAGSSQTSTKRVVGLKSLLW